MRRPYKDGELTELARKTVIEVVSWAAVQRNFRMCAVFGENDSVFCEPDGSIKETHGSLL